jgi:hypothetical protein
VRQASSAVEKEAGKASRGGGGGEKKEKKAKKAKGSKKGSKKGKKGTSAEEAEAVDPEAADAFDAESLPQGFKAQPGGGGEMAPSGASASETDMSASEAEDRDFGL